MDLPRRFHALHIDVGARSSVVNAALGGRALQQAAPLDVAARALLEDTGGEAWVTARGAARARRVARTIADLEGADPMRLEHLAEALQYRAYEARRWRAEGRAIPRDGITGFGGRSHDCQNSS